MKLIRLIAILLVLYQINGCAYLTSLQDDFEHQVDVWSEHCEYGKALDTLGYIRKDHPDYERLMAKRKKVALAADVYENKVVKEAEDLIKQGRWGEALNVTDQALARLPKSELLQKWKRELYKRQEVRLAELRFDLLIAQAQWLGNSLPIYESLSKANPRHHVTQRFLKKKQIEADKIVNELIRAGRDALDEGDLEKARHILSRALRLDPSIESEKVIKDLESAEIRQAKAIDQVKVKRGHLVMQAKAKKVEAIKLAKVRQVEAIELSRQRQTKEVLNAYEQAFFDKNLKEAIDLMQRLEELDSDNIEFRRRHQELEQVVKRATQQYLDEGIFLYSQAQFKQAIESWRKILEVDPDNKLAQSHIARANLALDKLQLLREKQLGAGQAP